MISEMALSINSALALAVVIVFVQGLGAARIRRSTDASTPLQDLLDNAKAHFQSVNQEWNKLVGSSNIDEMTPVLVNKTEELKSRFESLRNELKRQYETHGSEMSERTSAAIAEAINRLNASIDNFQSRNSGVMDEAAALQQRFQSDAEALFEEMGKVARASTQDAGTAQTELASLSRNAMARTMDLVQQLGNQFQQAVGSSVS